MPAAPETEMLEPLRSDPKCQREAPDALDDLRYPLRERQCSPLHEQSSIDAAQPHPQGRNRLPPLRRSSDPLHADSRDARVAGWDPAGCKHRRCRAAVGLGSTALRSDLRNRQERASRPKTADAWVANGHALPGNVRVGSTRMDKSTWDRRYTEREFVWTVEPNRFLVHEAEGLQPGRALDLACGEGRNAVWLAEHGWQVTGVDFAALGLDKARRLASALGVEGEWIVADLLEYRPEPRSFDLVLVLYLQLPASERTPVLRDAANAVADGGTFLVVAHDSSNLENGYGGPQHAEVLYTAEEVVADLDGSGLLIERAERVERTVETPDGVQIALDALVRASRSA